MTLKRLLLTTAVLSNFAFASAAFAGTFTATGSAPPNGTGTLTVSFAGDGATEDAQADININTTQFTVSAPQVLVPGSVCTILSGGSVVRVVPPSGAGTPLTNTATNYCGFTITALAPATAGNYPLTTAFLECAAPSGAQACTFNGSINVVAGPTAPTIALNPNPANIGAGDIGTTGSVTVNITTPTDGAGGGNATVACSIPAGTVGFTAGAVTGNPFTTGDGTVAVSCTRGAAAASGTLTCTATAGGGAPAGTTQATTTVNCPAGVASPEFNASLSSTLFGAPGTTATGGITVQNTGTAPLTITCGAAPAGFTVTTPPTSPVAAGGSTTIGLSCVTPATAGSTTTGSLVCTTNDSDEATVTFALACSSQTLAVPTMTTWGKAALASLLAAVGLLGFALRRKLV